MQMDTCPVTLVPLSEQQQKKKKCSLIEIFFFSFFSAKEMACEKSKERKGKPYHLSVPFAPPTLRRGEGEGEALGLAWQEQRDPPNPHFQSLATDKRTVVAKRQLALLFNEEANEQRTKLHRQWQKNPPQLGTLTGERTHVSMTKMFTLAFACWLISTTKKTKKRVFNLGCSNDKGVRSI